MGYAQMKAKTGPTGQKTTKVTYMGPLREVVSGLFYLLSL